MLRPRASLLSLCLALLMGCDRAANAQPQRHPRATPVVSTVALRDASNTHDDRDAGESRALSTLSREPWVTIAPGLRAMRARVRFSDETEAEWVVLRANLATVQLRAVRSPEEQLQQALAPNALAAIVAGFFDHDKRPSGVLVSGAEVLSPYRVGGGTGVLVIRDQSARLRASIDEAQSPTQRAELAVQCGPRLVEPGGIMGIRSDRGDRFARAAACIRDRGQTLDFVVTWSEEAPMRGPGLYAFAQALAGPSPSGDLQGCEAALNLDGGPSAGAHVRHSAQHSHAPLGPVPWAIVLQPRVRGRLVR
ncbi:MAG: phosphodiester glycosidase family protein [Deltaproteobacteria bacterium]|nr:phosphodiester glycosidase family protein [Deltaproteobacteria bacterium]